MCLGIPMQVISCHGEQAICRHGEEQVQVDMSLLERPSEGSWVLVFMGAARELITESRAQQISLALQAVEAVMTGKEADFDSLFVDLVEREPQLPSHLQNNN